MDHTSHLAEPLLAAIAVLAAAACGGTDAKPTPSPGVTRPSGGATSDVASGAPSPGSPCDIHTPYAGDDACIPPPAPEKGLQLHVGPTDYDDPDPAWVLSPGKETVECYHLKSPNTELRYYFKQKYRMRPGSHHMILLQSSNLDQPEGWTPCDTSFIGAIGGTQHTSEDFPPGDRVAEEDVGLARPIEAGQPLDIQLHFFNATDAPILRETWVNFYYKDESEVTEPLGPIGGFASVNVAPHTSTVTGGTCAADYAVTADATSAVRVVSLFGHAHWHNKRFVVYRHATDGSESVVYDSYDGAEAPTYVYNSVIQNPVPNPEANRSGAESGVLLLERDESLRFECDITNDLNVSLVSTNEAFTGEMCILFGTMVGTGFPCFKPAATM
jgi:hypothetical protein